MAMMPQMAGGGGLPAPATQSPLGVPQPMGMGIDSMPDSQAISELMQLLKGGQVGAERFLELLSLLAGSTLPGLQQQPQGQQPGMEQGMPSIQQLMGGM